MSTYPSCPISRSRPLQSPLYARRRFLAAAAITAQAAAFGVMVWVAAERRVDSYTMVLAAALFLVGPLVLMLSRRKSTELNESQTRMRQIVDTSLDAVITMDAQGLIAGWSAQAEPIFGWSAREVVGRNLADTIIPERFRGRHNQGIRHYMATGVGPVLNKRIEISAIRRNGEEFPIELAIAPLKFGRQTIFSAFIRDISQSKKAATELLAAKEQAEAANRAKSEFLANMSHEIRTPMNGVIGMTDLLLGSELNEQQRRYASIVKTSADSLLALINDILDFSKIEAGKLELNPSPFDLGLAVEDAVEMFAQRAQQKGLDLCCHVDPSLQRRLVGDPDRLRQILINLVGNALKFTQRGEVIIRAVPCDPAPDKSGGVMVHISVRDSGIGIPRDRMDRLFKSFSQVDASTTRKYGGTGLGLAICKQLAEMMGGTIGVDSREGEGSTFWFTAFLADAPAEAEQATQRPSVKPDARGLRVLVVDHSAAQRQVLKEQLESWGFNARVAGDGEKALEDLLGAAAMGKPYGVAIMDEQLGDMDARNLVRRIKVEKSINATPLMLLCGVEHTPATGEAARQDFRGFISKPVRQSQLFDSIISAIDGVAPQSTHVMPSTPVSPRGHRKSRVLLADDHEINRMVAEEVLARAGFECVSVNDGQAAADAVAAGGYDVILMDCQMPVLDGFEATRIIRRREQAGESECRIPIIALTANALKGDREKCLEAGMDGYISKPLDPVKLVQAIQAVLPKADIAAPAAAVAPAVSSAESPPIDLPSVMQRCGGNKAFVSKMLGKFVEQSSQSLTKLQDAVRDGNALDANRAAHGLKGTAALLSAERVRALAAELEVMGAANQLEKAMRTVEQLQNELRICSDYIPKLVGEMAET